MAGTPAWNMLQHDRLCKLLAQRHEVDMACAARYCDGKMELCLTMLDQIDIGGALHLEYLL